MKVEQFLHPEAICLQLTAENAEEVIRLLGTKLHALGHVKDGFIEATLEREKKYANWASIGWGY